MSKRNRQVFSSEEKMNLKQLIKKYHSIIENKKTDFINQSQKRKTWAQITNEFNSSNINTRRSTDQLKKCWDNMKTRRKQELATNKRFMMATGGGPSRSPPKPDDIDDILETVNIEIENVLDSATFENGNKQTSTVNESFKDICTLENETHINDKVEVEINDNISKTQDTYPERNTAESNAKKNYLPRRTAIEHELGTRLERNNKLIGYDEELHKLKIEEQLIKISIAKEQLLQEKIKTKMLLKNLNEDEIKEIV